MILDLSLPTTKIRTKTCHMKYLPVQPVHIIERSLLMSLFMSFPHLHTTLRRDLATNELTPRVITSSFDWFAVLSVSFVIG